VSWQLALLLAGLALSGLLGVLVVRKLMDRDHDKRTA
jgi:hypothetical protein